METQGAIEKFYTLLIKWFAIHNICGWWRLKLLCFSMWSARSSHRSCSVKKVLLKISRNLQENTCARVSFLIKLQAWDHLFIEHLWATASEALKRLEQVVVMTFRKTNLLIIFRKELELHFVNTKEKWNEFV